MQKFTITYIMKLVYSSMLLLFLSVSVNAKTLSFTKEELEYISKNPTIKISNKLNWYPYDFNERGDANGYIVDILKLLTQNIGLNIEFIEGDRHSLNKKFDSKKIDILYPVRKTKKREETALFSDRFIERKLSLISKIDKKEIKSLDDMKDKTLATVKGWSGIQYMKNRYKNIKYIEFDTSKEMLEAVAFGLADGGIEDFFSADYIIKKEMYSNLHIVSKIYIDDTESHDLYFMFHKNNYILKSIFNKAFYNIKQEDILKIKSKWLNMYIGKELILTKDEKKYIENKKIVKMCIDPNWMPLEMLHNGKHVGMTSDYMQLVQQRAGISIELIKTETWAESIEFARQRKCDIFSLAMATPERKLYMNFTKPYLNMPLVLVSTLDTNFYLNVDMIRNKSIGIVKGYAYGEILRAKYPNMKLVYVESMADGLKKVENKELFGFIGTLATLAYQIQREYFGSLKIAGKFEEEWKLGIGVRNDEPFLLSIMEKAIDSIDINEHQAILNRWISIKYDKKINYKRIFQSLAFVFLLFMFFLYRHYQLKKYNKILKTLSTIDKLTGIYNRLKLDEVLKYEKDLFDRFNTPLSIIILDIDDFKRVNDSFGHKIGDEVLQDIVKIVFANKRKTDILGRWGGEEFLIISHETDLNGAKKLAEKFRKIIFSHKFVKNQQLSASFGVAEFKKNDSIEQVFIRADKRLYSAKDSGKNSVM